MGATTGPAFPTKHHHAPAPPPIRYGGNRDEKPPPPVDLMELINQDEGLRRQFEALKTAPKQPSMSSPGHRVPKGTEGRARKNQGRPKKGRTKIERDSDSEVSEEEHLKDRGLQVTTNAKEVGYARTSPNHDTRRKTRKWYVVLRGRKIGIFADQWERAKSYINGFSDGYCQAFRTYTEAKAFYREAWHEPDSGSDDTEDEYEDPQETGYPSYQSKPDKTQNKVRFDSDGPGPHYRPADQGNGMREPPTNRHNPHQNDRGRPRMQHRKVTPDPTNRRNPARNGLRHMDLPARPLPRIRFTRQNP